MWALYLLSHTWLLGSLLLPFMLLLRWGGAHWRGLRLLTSSRKRWILIWGSYGTVKMVALAALLWVHYSPEYIPFDSLGWSATAVMAVLHELHLRLDSVSMAYLLVASLTVIVEAAIHCGLAAIVWWVFKWSTQEVQTHGRVVAIERYGISLLFSACVFGIANHVQSWRQAPCDDCFQPHGVPFTFFHEGGIEHSWGFVRSGVIGNAFVIFLVAVVLGWVWNWLSQRPSIGHSLCI